MCPPRSLAAAASLAVVLAACGRTAPTEAGAPAVFALVVPSASASAPATVRTVAVVAGRLEFARFGAASGAVTGRVTLRITLRITDPGAAPVTQEAASTGRATQRGDTVTVVFDTGASESFAVEDGGATLRTVAASCGPNPCTDVLRINVYRRASG